MTDLIAFCDAASKNFRENQDDEGFFFFLFACRLATWGPIARVEGVAVTGPAIEELPEATTKRLFRSDKQDAAPDTSGKPCPLLLEQTVSPTYSTPPSCQTTTQQRAQLPSAALSRRDLISPSLPFRRLPRPFSSQQLRICAIVNRHFTPAHYPPLIARSFSGSATLVQARTECCALLGGGRGTRTGCDAS